MPKRSLCYIQNALGLQQQKKGNRQRHHHHFDNANYAMCYHSYENICANETCKPLANISLHRKWMNHMKINI